MKVSIQGNLGSFSHIAAMHFFGDQVKLVERNSFQEVFSDLENKNVEYIVVPIENSTHGSIQNNFDLLSKFKFSVVAEVFVKVNFHLIGLRGSRLEDIEEIYTHPVALSQIRKFLERNNKIISREFSDTAGGVNFVVKNENKHFGAVASRLASEIYNAEIIVENIHDNPKNFTRFFLISLDAQDIFSKENPKKTTIEFTISNKPGALVRALKPFADFNISLSKIESRPIMNSDWKYKFYADLESGLNDPQFKTAFEEFKKQVEYIYIHGSYKKGALILS